MTRMYPRSKTVRFSLSSFLLIETAASDAGVTTSEYIRDAALDALAEAFPVTVEDDIGLPGVKLCA